MFSSGLLLALFTLIRIPFMRQSFKGAANHEDKQTAINYTIASVLVVGAGFLCLLNPSLIKWSAIDLPSWIRFLGIFLGLIGNVLLLWTHRSLGKSFAMFVSSTTEHQLIRNGPYKSMCHPMYTAFFLIAFGFFLAASNLLFLAFILLMLYPLSFRVRDEEKYLTDVFGDEYLVYMKHTKRFIPFVY